MKTDILQLSELQIGFNLGRFFTIACFIYYCNHSFSQDYVMKLEKAHAEKGKTLSYCELNLETWRQLWRVLEISDIILVIVDARYPVSRISHFLQVSFIASHVVMNKFTFLLIIEFIISTVAIRVRHANIVEENDFGIE